MPRSKTREPRKVASQERSRVTLEIIFEAMGRVIAKSNVDDFSAAEVARVAGVGRASIYDYYPTREALVTAWEERTILRGLARVADLIQELLVRRPSVEESVVRVVDAVCE